MADKTVIDIIEWFAKQYSTPEQRKDRWHIPTLAFAVQESLTNGIDAGIGLLKTNPVYEPSLLPAMVEDFKKCWGHLENPPLVLSWVAFRAH